MHMSANANSRRVLMEWTSRSETHGLPRPSMRRNVEKNAPRKFRGENSMDQPGPLSFSARTSPQRNVSPHSLQIPWSGLQSSLQFFLIPERSYPQRGHSGELSS